MIQVFSEIAPLKKVMLHRPGRELEQLLPETLDRLLFDDIPFLDAAQQEHDYFAQILRDNGAEVVYLEQLMAETIAQSPEIKERFVDEFIAQSGSVAQHYGKELKEYLSKIDDNVELVRSTMGGVTVNQLTKKEFGPLVKMVSREFKFALDPIPNLYFTRDPFASIGNGASLNHMYSVTRNRETIYGRFILNHHKDYAGTVPFYYSPDHAYTVEGGDILVLSDKVLAVGISQRTGPEGIELLARKMFEDENCSYNTIFCMHIPNLRAYMHLDTVFTQVDVDKFTIHPNILTTLKVYAVRRKGTSPEYTVEEIEKPLEEALAFELGLDKVSLIMCGGADPIAAEREQWNDGANTLCISPGVVCVYNRNTITNKLLQEKGVKIIEMPSSELSRGRGGPRCMSMPLYRDLL